MVPDLILKAILASKKSVSEIFKFCENNNICQDTPLGDGKKQVRQVVAKQMFKISGYRVDKDFDYRKLFGEMTKILLNNKMNSPSKELSFDIAKNMDELVKISAADRKSLAATGSIELYAFLLYNGIDLRSSSPTGGNFKLESIRSVIDSTEDTEL